MKKVNQRKRALSFLLVLTLLFGTMTLFSFASEEEVTVLYEEESKRTEHEKHYFCSDGSYIAVSYPQAVHYLDDDGVYRDIDNSLSYDEERAAYENAGNPAFGVSLSSENGLETVKVKGKDKEEITFSTALLVNGNGKTAQPKKKNINAFNRTAKSAQGKRVKGSDTFDLPLVSSSLEYAKYYGEEAQTVTGRYTLNGNSLKEDIVLSAPAGVTGFLTTYKAGGLILTKNEDGSLTFSDEKGTALYTVGAPYMYDADGSACPAISVTVQKKGNKYEVSYLPDASWLNSSERVYPLTFDPTLEASVSDMMNCVSYQYYDGQQTASVSSTNVLRAGAVDEYLTTYIGFIPTASQYPEINLEYYEVSGVSLNLYVQTPVGYPTFTVYQLDSEANLNAPNELTSGTALGSVTFNWQTVMEFPLSTDHYYTENTQPKYAVLGSANAGQYATFYNYGNSQGKNPALIVKYRPKAWGTDPTESASQPMKFVLKNEANYLLSNGGTVTARVPQAKETIDAEDFYYCEWVFNYNSTYYAHTISPAYDEGLCLKANSDGTVSLVAITDALTKEHYWTWGADMSSDKLWIKNAQYGSRLYTTECTETTTGALHHDASNTISATQKEWSATRTYQGVYTFENVGTDEYMETEGGYNYNDTDILTSNTCGNEYGKNSFRLVYDETSDAYRIMPIASANGFYRAVSVVDYTDSPDVILNDQSAETTSKKQLFDLNFTSGGKVYFTLKCDSTKVLAASGGTVVLTSIGTSLTNAQLWTYSKSVYSDTESYDTVNKYYLDLGFIRPFALPTQMKVTSDFGPRNSTGSAIHKGVDFGVASGTPLYSPYRGTVVACGSDTDMGYYVKIKTDYKEYNPNLAINSRSDIGIIFMHMERMPAVSIGERVSANQLIGYSGNTGTSSGPHLHYGIFLIEAGSTDYGVNRQPLDPLLFFVQDKNEVEGYTPVSS